MDIGNETKNFAIIGDKSINQVISNAEGLVKEWHSSQLAIIKQQMAALKRQGRLAQAITLKARFDAVLSERMQRHHAINLALDYFLKTQHGHHVYELDVTKHYNQLSQQKPVNLFHWSMPFKTIQFKAVSGFSLIAYPEVGIAGWTVHCDTSQGKESLPRFVIAASIELNGEMSVFSDQVELRQQVELCQEENGAFAPVFNIVEENACAVLATLLSITINVCQRMLDGRLKAKQAGAEPKKQKKAKKRKRGEVRVAAKKVVHLYTPPKPQPKPEPAPKSDAIKQPGLRPGVDYDVPARYVTFYVKWGKDGKRAAAKLKKWGDKGRGPKLDTTKFNIATVQENDLIPMVMLLEPILCDKDEDGAQVTKIK